MTSTPEKRIYCGVITVGDFGDNFQALSLSDDSDPLAMRVEADLGELGRFVTARYWISEIERPIEEIQENTIHILMGDGLSQDSVTGWTSQAIQYVSHYSEVTGYLWTDEQIILGGHDIIEELRSYKGWYCWLEMEYSAEPNTVE